MKKHLIFVEQLFTVLGLILYSGAILTLFVSGGVSEGEIGDELPVDSTLIKQIFLIFYLITIVLLGCRWQKALYLASKNVSILLFTGLAIISVTWSTSQDVTFARAIALLGTNLFGLYLASRYTLKQQIILLSQAFSIIALLSILLVIVLPAYGKMGGSHEGAWRGVYNHKNVLGKFAAMSMIVFFLKSIINPNQKILIYFVWILSIILVIASKSSTAISNSIIIIAIFFVLKIWRQRYEIAIPTCIALISLMVIFSLWFNDNSSLLFSSVGKDPSLTGRTNIWSLVWDMALKEPWRGYGYGAFWADLNGPALTTRRAIHWNAPNAHNGFLDLYIDLGLSGAVLIAMSFINTFFRAFIYLRYSKTSDGLWPLIFISYFVLSNLTESGLMIPNYLFTVLYVTLSYSMIINTNVKIGNRLYGDLSQT